MHDYYTKTEASVQTFLEQNRKGKLNTNAHRVYQDLKKYPNSSKDEVIKRLNLPHQTVTSRISVLMDLGIVKAAGTRATIGANGNAFESLFKVVTDPDEIKACVKKRLELKLKRLKKQLKQFSDIIPIDTYESLQAIKI
jgi:predicted transcriptional regulator